MTGDEQATAFVQKCHELPLDPGDRESLESIERNIR
jgi:hypothetical protein